VRPGCHQFIEDGHDVAIRVLDHVKAHLALRLYQLLEEGTHDAPEHCRAQERARVQTIVGAKRKAIQPAMCCQFGALFQHSIDAPLPLIQGPLDVVIEPGAPFQHLLAVGNRVGGIAVHHDKVAIPAESANIVDQAERLIQGVGVRVDKDRVVFVTFGRLDV